LRKLHSTEAIDYSKGFYQNEFLDSISSIYVCDKSKKEFLDLTELRKHVVTKH